MDPIGLSLEEYDAVGRWRDRDLGKRIETAGQLITGEKFANTIELEHVIANQRRVDFERCLAEKMLTFAIGRGVEYYDAPTIDTLVATMARDGGKLRTLVHGIVASAPFQQRRGDGDHAATTTNDSPKPTAGAKVPNSGKPGSPGKPHVRSP
jgi:hypothetical protein